MDWEKKTRHEKIALLKSKWRKKNEGLEDGKGGEQIYPINRRENPLKGTLSQSAIF